MKRYTLPLILLLCLGCEAKSDPSNPVVPLSEISPELIEVAQKTLPDVKFDSAARSKSKARMCSKSAASCPMARSAKSK